MNHKQKTPLLTKQEAINTRKWFLLDATGKTLGRFAAEVAKQLQESGYRVKADLRNEKIGFKIREHTLLKVPYLLVIGDREVESQTVAVRTRDGQDLGSISVDEFRTLLAGAVAQRGR